VKKELAKFVCVSLLLAFWCGATRAGDNSTASIALSPTMADGDTLAYRVVVGSAVETRVLHVVVAYDTETMEFAGWEQGDFLENVFQIGPRVNNTSGTVLIALGVSAATDNTSGDMGTLRFVRTAPGQPQVGILEAAFVDSNHEEDWIIEDSGQIEFAPPAQADLDVPVRFAFRSVTPNPIASRTAVNFDIPLPGAHVKIKIYDVSGREVRTLVDEHKSPGYYSKVWDTRNNGRKRVAPGIYFCRVEAGDFKDTKKMILLR
jgi:hypothetical protein